MKSRFFLFAAMCGVLLTSCKDENLLLGNNPGGLKIEVEDEVAVTRADYTVFPGTNFEEGDAIGIYVMNGSSVVTANVKYTRQSDGTWEAASSAPYNPDYTYYAYFPWVEEAPAFHEDGSTIDEKFAAFIESSTFLLEDQSTKANFTQSNLMSAQGVESGAKTMKFTMQHKRGLVVIDNKLNKYYYVDAAGTKLNALAELSGHIPYEQGDKLYYHVMPDTPTTIAGMSVRVSKGKYINPVGFSITSAPVYTYSVSSDGGTTWSEYTTTPPSWLSVTATTEGANPTEFVITRTSGSTDLCNIKASYDGVSFILSAEPMKGYLKFTALEDGTFSFSKAGLSYSLDNGETWTELAAGASTPTIAAGEEVLWKNNTSSASTGPIGRFSSTARYDVSGNILSLNCFEETMCSGLYENLFYNNTLLCHAENLLLSTAVSGGCYASMFAGCTSLTSAPALPATSLRTSCYTNMFLSCTSLVSAPALPATKLATGCYASMFAGCTSLTSAPVLPATELATFCYSSMFNGCTSLTSAPALPATALANNCYQQMFSGCTSLASSPALPATSLAQSCYSYMFQRCTSLTSAPELPATSLANNCYAGMFQMCTSLVSAPVLPATSLALSCYQNMFNGCKSLASAPALPATSLADNCYEYMFSGCTSLASAPALPAMSLVQNCYRNMFQGCTSLTNAPTLPAIALTDNCYAGMFQMCTSLVSAPALPATSLALSCYQNMFNGCKSLASAPALPATNLAQSCYEQMFFGCSSLNYIKAMFLTTPGTSYTKAWLYNVKSTGTFVKNASATWDVTGVDGIPSGWTVETATE